MIGGSQAQDIFQDSDVPYFIRVLNIFLQESPPLTPESLLKLSQTGKLFAKILNKISPNALIQLTEDKFAEGLSSHLTIENLDRLTLTAQNLGVRIGYVYSDGIVKGNINVILHFIFNLLKFHFVLRVKKQEMDSKREEDILVEWITNWTGTKIRNFTEDLKNGEIYDVLLKSLGINGKKEELNQLQTQDQPQPQKLVNEVIQRVKEEKLGIWMEEKDIENGNKIMNIFFCCAIYERVGGRRREVGLEEDKVRERRKDEGNKEKGEIEKKERKEEIQYQKVGWYFLIAFFIVVLGISVMIMNKKKK